MEIRIYPTREDFMEMCNAILLGKRPAVVYRHPLLSALACLLLFGAATACSLYEVMAGRESGIQRTLSILLLAVGVLALLVLILLLLVVLLTRRQYGKMAEQKEAGTLVTLTGEGIRSDALDNSQHLSFRWDTIQRLIFTKNLVVFITSNGIALLFPLRYLEGQETEFWQIVDPATQGKERWKVG